MKKILSILLILSGIAAQAQLYIVDTTTTNSPHVYTNTALMTAPGVFTNLSVTFITTNSSKGTPLPDAFGMVNTNFVQTTNLIVTNGFKWYAPSNYFNLNNLTNGMKAGDFKTFNSNGAALVAVLFQTNGVPLFKTLAP